jgi:hypothetical protein
MTNCLVFTSCLFFCPSSYKKLANSLLNMDDHMKQSCNLTYSIINLQKRLIKNEWKNTHILSNYVPLSCQYASQDPNYQLCQCPPITKIPFIKLLKLYIYKAKTILKNNNNHKKQKRRFFICFENLFYIIFSLGHPLIFIFLKFFSIFQFFV